MDINEPSVVIVLTKEQAEFLADTLFYATAHLTEPNPSLDVVQKIVSKTVYPTVWNNWHWQTLKLMEEREAQEQA